MLKTLAAIAMAGASALGVAVPAMAATEQVPAASTSWGQHCGWQYNWGGHRWSWDCDRHSWGWGWGHQGWNDRDHDWDDHGRWGR